MPHSGGPAKGPVWVPPRGSNSLWEDGHVKWTTLTGGVVGDNNATSMNVAWEYRMIATGYNGTATPAPEEGLTWDYAGSNYMYTARRAK